jgi:predicted DNA-binding transcriptional regulator AlpA
MRGEPAVPIRPAIADPEGAGGPTPVNGATPARGPAALAMTPLLLRAAQAAAYCGVSEPTWWRWDAAGRIPRGHKVSAGVKVWSRPELDAWAGAGLPDRAAWEVMKAAQRNGRPN